MAKVRMKFSEQCRRMKIYGVNIIGNPDTGSIIGLDSEGTFLVEQFENGEQVDLETLNHNQTRLFKALVTHGYFMKAQQNHSVYSTYLHVTSHCNLKCPGCYSYENDRNAVQDLTLDEIKKILDNLVKAGLSRLIISGGEPFVRSDLLDILAYARSKSQIQYIECITNGTLPVEKYMKASQYLDMLSFSLDSADAQSAKIRPAKVFCEATQKIVLLKKEGVPLTIVFTIHRGNVSDCQDLLSFASKMNVEARFGIFTVIETNETKTPFTMSYEDYDILYKFGKRQQHGVPIEDSTIGKELGCVLSCGAGKKYSRNQF